ncbi:MAG: class I SAM-dependent methyltransferase [Ghiorsea sp.]|nr:class I SAM-dependent methyltransferase [Ghiorsea sp.]
MKALRRKIFSPFRKFNHFTSFNEQLDRGRLIAKFIKDHVNENNVKINYLDVGCNRGFLLAAAAEFNWNIYGNEVVPEQIAPFKKTYKQFADNITSEKLNATQDIFQKEYFDVISGIDVIEHFEGPLNDMEIIYSLLKPGGYFVIQTPDTDCDKAKQLGAKWGALKPLEHLHLFNSSNLEKLSEIVGYKSIEFFPQLEEADGNFVAIMKK